MPDADLIRRFMPRGIQMLSWSQVMDNWLAEIGDLTTEETFLFGPDWCYLEFYLPERISMLLDVMVGPEENASQPQTNEGQPETIEDRIIDNVNEEEMMAVADLYEENNKTVQLKKGCGNQHLLTLTCSIRYRKIIFEFLYRSLNKLAVEDKFCTRWLKVTRDIFLDLTPKEWIIVCEWQI